MATVPSIAGLILAGGASTRMGRNKADLPFAKSTLLRHCYQRLSKQAFPIIVSSNSPLEDRSIIRINDPDGLEFAGPLAGIAAGLQYLSARTDVEWLQSVAVDNPFFPTDLVQRLQRSSSGQLLVCAKSQGRTHPTVALWHKSLLPQIEDFLVAQNGRKMMAFLSHQEHMTVDFGHFENDPFFNINTPDDLKQAQIQTGTSPGVD